MINSAAAPTANQILSYDGSSFQWINTPSGTFSLPYSGTFSSAGPLLALNNSGSGPAASFLGSGDQIHLQGTAIGGPNFAYMSFADSAGTLTGFVGDAGSDTAIFLGAYSGSVVLYTSPAGRVLTATPTGNVGIGTSDPGRRLTIQAAYDGDGVQVIGSRAGVKDAGYILSDDTGNTAALGLATFANAWFTGAQPGDLCLGANQGNVRIGVATGLETPVMSVGRKTVVLSPNYPDAGNVTLTAASVDGTALYCHSYGTPFHAHNDFTGTDAVLAGGWHAFTGNVTVRTSPGYGIVHTDGIREVGTYVDDSGGWLGTKSNHPLNLFVNDGGAALRIDTDNTVSLQVLTITGGADIAEPFPMTTEEIPKGAVVTIDEDHPGQLKMSESAYDTRVAGIISGANGIKPGVSLHQQGALEGTDNVALSGRVYALADASEAPIKPGDLLTTSATPGHCMKVTDHAKAQGTIIGKAMSTLKEGKGKGPDKGGDTTTPTTGTTPTTDDPATGDDHGHGHAAMQIEGFTSSVAGTCPELTIVINDMTVQTDATTDFQRADCSDLAPVTTTTPPATGTTPTSGTADTTTPTTTTPPTTTPPAASFHLHIAAQMDATGKLVATYVRMQGPAIGGGDDQD
jgi:hypothetical protein